MKNKLFILLLLLIVNSVYAQDFDIYPRPKNDNFEMPKVYDNMLFDEYQLLSRNVRLMDMVYSAIVPGYVHFKAKDKLMGYSLLGTRLLAYSGLAISYLDLKSNGVKLSDLQNSSSAYNNDKIILVSSITLIASTYLFDWIHGKYRLERKQENIRYKYSIKLQMNSMAFNRNDLTPSLTLTYKF